MDDVPSAPEVTRLIEQAQAGDAAALGGLLEQYRAYLRLLAGLHINRRLAGKADASDLVQETFLEAGRDFGQFRGTDEKELVAWLRQILANNLADLVRRHCSAECRDVHVERRLLDELSSSSQGLGGGLVGPASTPSHHASQREQAVLVADAMARLPQDYCQVLVLRHLEGLSFAQIAQRLDRSTDSVKNLWARALARLRGSFAGPES
jgi:RNA polymerase sigma-70 factor (ECF subfamily)